MPLFENEDISADDALAKGLCPECGADLKTENPIAHLNTHWKAPMPYDSRGNEPRRRQAMLQKFIADNNVPTTNMPTSATTIPSPLP